MDWLLTSVYGWSLGIGFAGLMAMALLGAGHLGHGHGHSAIGHGHGAGGSHAGHLGHGGAHAGHGAAHGVSHAAGHGAAHSGHGHAAPASGHGSSAQIRGFIGSRFSPLALLSPRLWFSLALGFGATGLLLDAVLHGLLLAVVAVIGAILGEKLVFGRILNVVMGFQSRPARTLESAVAEEARAATNFNAEGFGLVSLELDGQITQLLGQLSEAEQGEHTRVSAGDRLFVEGIDAVRGRCTVSRLQ